MINKMPKNFLRFIAAGSVLLVTAVSCNNSEEKKETPKDTTATAAPATAAPAGPVDTTHKAASDTGKPVKTPD